MSDLIISANQIVASDSHFRSLTHTVPSRWKASASILLILVLVVNANSKLARIRSIRDGAMFPVLVVEKLALEVKSVVDVGEAELDVGVLPSVSKELSRRQEWTHVT